MTIEKAKQALKDLKSFANNNPQEFDNIIKELGKNGYVTNIDNYSAHDKKNHPHPIFIGLGVKKLTNCRNTVLSLLKNTKRRPSINISRPSANKLA